jgi:hypothetical protein
MLVVQYVDIYKYDTHSWRVLHFFCQVACIQDVKMIIISEDTQQSTFVSPLYTNDKYTMITKMSSIRLETMILCFSLFALLYNNHNVPATIISIY